MRSGLRTNLLRAELLQMTFLADPAFGASYIRYLKYNTAAREGRSYITAMRYWTATVPAPGMVIACEWVDVPLRDDTHLDLNYSTTTGVRSKCKTLTLAINIHSPNISLNYSLQLSSGRLLCYVRRKKKCSVQARGGLFYP